MILISQRYYSDPWLQELTTSIVSQHIKDDRNLVVLAETIFYPTGGGQPHDLGSINGISVIDVFEENGVIFHVLKAPLQGDEALCVLDWHRRLDHMQQHSGQHLLSAVFQDEYGYRTESFHLGADYCSIDISTPILSTEEQMAAEDRANAVVFSNLPLRTYTLRSDERATVPLRKVPDLAGDLRIVEIAGFDYSPCSGTHVQSTSQIGLLKIIKSEKNKGMTRVYFLCGGRALRDYGRKQEICARLGSLLSVPETELIERTCLEIEGRQGLEKQMAELKNELMGFRAHHIVSQEKSPFSVELQDATIEEAQQLARSILELTTGVVIINLGERLVLTHNQGTSLHLGQLIKEKGHPLGGRGGGSPTSAQVYFPDPAGLSAFLQLLTAELLQ